MKAGHNRAEIAAIINVDKSTISREMRRNQGGSYRLRMTNQFGPHRRQAKVQ